jgi:ribosomal protein S18 acetylase RimI-like enzyme
MTAPVVEVRAYRNDDVDSLVDIAKRIPRLGVDPLSHPRLADLVATYFVLVSLKRGASVTTVIEVDGVVRGSCLATPDRAAHGRDGSMLVAPFRELPGELDDPKARKLAASLLERPPGHDAHLEALPGGLHTELDPRLQGLGAGGRVVTAAVDRMRAAGVPGILLPALPEGTHQRRFYERLGFTAVDGQDDGLGIRLAQS